MSDQQKAPQSYFDEIKLGNMVLKNRIVMASLTRVRCNYGEEVANDLLVEYYTTRAGMGLILTEASAVSQNGHSFPGAANCFTEKQKNGWKKVVDSVHNAGGKIFIQLAHGGRTAVGNVVLAPSAIQIAGVNPFTQRDFSMPTEMTLDDIKQVIQEFSYSASLAKEAGFDGVVLHAANGYLLDEFTRDGSNLRKDAYGGSISNRCRLLLEVVDAVVKVFGKDRVGIKISPTGRYNDMFDSDPIATYSYLLSKLDQKGIGFVEIKEAAPHEVNNKKQAESKFPQPTEQCPDIAKALRNSFSGVLINNDSFDYQKGLDRIKSGVCQMISFGRLALANPDLAYRFQNNLSLNQIDYTTLFTNFGKGYNDYPTYEQSQKKEKSYFDKYNLKDLVLQNRIVMAPLTRKRCDYKDLVPNDLLVEYYCQRGDFGLIITEATSVSKRGHSWPGAACLYNEAQRDGWKRVVDAVHQKGAKIFIQLFHGGRSSDEEINGGLQTIAPSAIKIDDNNPFNQNKPYKMPREITIEEIKGVIQQFKESAILAKQAGFDGVQVHAANGYLVDEFLRDGSNQRTDEYGGSIENRCKFCLEVVDQIIEVFGNKRVAVRVSPTGRYTDMYDSDPIPLYTHLFQQLDKKNIAFVEIKEANVMSDKKKNDNDDRKLPLDQCPDVCAALKPAFSGTIMNNDGFTYQSGLDKINTGVCDLISFGRYAIANPDLVQRFKNNWELNPCDYTTLFTNEAKGYTDYPTYEQLQEQKKLNQDEQQKQQE